MTTMIRRTCKLPPTRRFGDVRARRAVTLLAEDDLVNPTGQKTASALEGQCVKEVGRICDQTCP